MPSVPAIIMTLAVGMLMSQFNPNAEIINLRIAAVTIPTAAVLIIVAITFNIKKTTK